MVRKSKVILSILKEYQKTYFKYIITLDESWFFLKNEMDSMYAESKDNVIPKISDSILSEKINITIAFCGNRLFCLKGFNGG